MRLYLIRVHDHKIVDEIKKIYSKWKYRNILKFFSPLKYNKEIGNWIKNGRMYYRHASTVKISDFSGEWEIYSMKLFLYIKQIYNRD